MKFGAHVSIAGSIELSIKRAMAIGCDTFQIFTRNPRSWIAKELTEDVISKFRNSVLDIYQILLVLIQRCGINQFST